MESLSKDDLITLIDLLNRAFREIGSSPVEELPLELALISWCGENEKEVDENKKDGSKEIPKAEETREEKNDKVGSETEFQESLPGEMLEIRDDVWKNILALVKPVNATMEALLRAAKPISYNGKILTLGVYYKFHKERIEEARHRKTLEEIVAKVLQSPTKVNCVLVEPPPKKIVEDTKIETILTEGKDKDIVEIAEKIFSN